MIKIKAIGVDIEEIDRFPDFESNKHFYEKIFTTKEIKYCKNKKNYKQHFAGKFCVKEAIKKCFEEFIDFKSIEILNNSDGKPLVIVRNKNENILISISHSKNNVVAVATVL